ncbi:hypothetical protein FINN_44 [Bacillus phage Finn]|uniref:Uncharacterized protein n=1 Tax=Bacillus phage Finn TaxID=2884419 RepID=M1I9C8_9CAUD|nr:hypothetical protein FINN_44 [Bacillus phage Finn]AGE61037.1 hypothetical protein FINN_44 [Bacillus phage Finn]
MSEIKSETIEGSDNKFPWLDHIGGGYRVSELAEDKHEIRATLQYALHESDKRGALEIEQDDGMCAVFFLDKDHIPFLKQLVKDLEEVTK